MTYVHDDVDRINILPLLAHGANCVVFDCIGLLDSSPIAPNAEDIAKYTCLSLKTVRSALTILLFNELVSESEGRYRPLKYIEYRGTERHDLPILPSESDGKKVFPPPIIIDPLLLKENNNHSLKEEEIIIIERRRILQTGGILGKPLEELSKKPIELETAQSWADWLQEQKATPKFNPQGTAVNALRANPRAEPPAIHKPAERKREFHAQGVLWERLQAERARKDKD